jgi:sigma-54 dependent transcriptional regulator, flagellar regulatory protein
MKMTGNRDSSNANSDLVAKLIGNSDAMRQLRETILRVARSNASVLLVGPSGAGKELVAQAIHDQSARSANAFSAVNCGAIPADLVESELFGHEKGAFTGAISRRVGHFEASHRGTIFLDEIGDMRFDMQVKLLRVLEERMICRVGSTEMRPVDIRVICATHQDLPAAIARKEFREDLFFRLGVVVIAVPSLASRLEDIPALIRHFQSKVPAEDRCRFSPEAIALLQGHAWPGNVRELRNLIERANTLFQGETIDSNIAAMLLDPYGMTNPLVRDPQPMECNAGAGGEHHEPFASRYRAPSNGQPIDLKREIESIELEQIHVALELADGIIAEAARLLSLKRTTLVEKMRKYGLQHQAA